MTWARTALASGLIVLLAAFAMGTENGLRAGVPGQARDCGPAISASWLLSGTPDHANPGPAATDDERRAATACRPVVHTSRLMIVSIMGLGGLLALIGWSAIGSRGPAERRRLTPAGM